MLNGLLEFIKETTAILLPAKCYICGRRLWNKQICHYCLPTLPENVEKKCSICYAPLGEADLLEGDNTISATTTCLACRYMPLPFKQVRYLWNYSGSARELVTIMKYHPSPALCRVAGELLVQALPRLNFQGSFDCVVAIPSSKRNLQLRGFNQCEILAQAVARYLEIPYSRKALRHIKTIKPQASLSHKERLSNINNAFSAKAKFCVNKNILLIDDVVTTGATTQTASIALLKAGASSVSLLSLIRSDNWLRFRDELFIKYKKAFKK